MVGIVTPAVVQGHLFIVNYPLAASALPADRYLLKHAVDMLTNLRLYEDGVQDTLLASATQYYTRESCALINVRHPRRGRVGLCEVSHSCCTMAFAFPCRPGSRVPKILFLVA